MFHTTNNDLYPQPTSTPSSSGSLQQGFQRLSLSGTSPQLRPSTSSNRGISVLGLSSANFLDTGYSTQPMPTAPTSTNSTQYNNPLSGLSPPSFTFGDPLSSTTSGASGSDYLTTVSIGAGATLPAQLPSAQLGSSTANSSNSASTGRQRFRSLLSSSTRTSSTSHAFTEAELYTLRTLSKLLGQLHSSTSQCRRIQRGSPGAGSLSMSMAKSKKDLNDLKPTVHTVLNNHPQLRARFNFFDNVLNEDINERGYEDGYTDRVRYLERMNYECGQLKGMVDAILERIWTSGRS